MSLSLRLHEAALVAELSLKRFVGQPLHRLWQANRGLFLFFLLIVVPLKSSVADWNWVPTGSMNPGIQEGDLILVNKAAYDIRFPLTLHRLQRHGDPERGDIIVCFAPDDGTRLVKRVVAVPGDTVEMRNNHLIVNGERSRYRPAGSSEMEGLRSEVINAAEVARESVGGDSRMVMALPFLANRLRDFVPRTLPEGQFFILGDNRDNSRDSRSFGTIPRHLIVGEAKTVLVSFDRYRYLRPKFSRWFTNLD